MAAHGTTIDQARLEAFLGQSVTDMGAALNAVLVMLGGDLGIWQAMAGAGPLTAAEVGERAGLRERYAREWLSAQAASGYVEYDPGADTFELPAEHAMALADETSPVFLLGGYHLVSSAWKDRAQIAERFRSGRGMGWHEHDAELFHGAERFFGPGYRTHLVADWIPALEGVEDKLRAGARIADVGCGHGVSTGVMAQAFPNSRVYGFDMHEPSIERAREIAASSGADHNVEFAVSSAKDIPNHGTTSSASSTACTTWAIRWERSSTCGARSPRTAP